MVITHKVKNKQFTNETPKPGNWLNPPKLDQKLEHGNWQKEQYIDRPVPPF